MIIILPSLSLQFLIRIVKMIGLLHDVIKSAHKKTFSWGLLHCVQRLVSHFSGSRAFLTGNMQ